MKINFQNEFSQFRPRSPYAVSKLYAHWITDMYRGVMVYFVVQEYCLIKGSTGNEFRQKKLWMLCVR